MYQLTYYGIANFRIQFEDGRNIQIDPYFGLSKKTWEDMPKIDYLAVSHGAGDHVGNSLDILKRDRPAFIAGNGVLEYAKLKGAVTDNGYVMVYGAPRQFGDIHFKAVHASHLSMISLGNGVFISDPPLGYIITLPDGLKIYHPGDTALFGDMKIIGELYKPDLMLLPVGMLPGAVTEMGPEEAAIAAEWIRPKVVVPIHYDIVGQKDYPDILKEHLAIRAPYIKMRKMEVDETMPISKELIQKGC
jgi:L-ascorbate metabolism protein UlaG (beta-lactamase superfamily)